MADFDDWVKSSLPKYCQKLLSLGASWDSFRRDSEEVISDLVKGGIPLLPAKDIVEKAREILQSRNAPMAIFWDLDSITFPGNCTGREVISCLRAELSHYGLLAQLRGYANNSIASIPEKSRCEMIEGGCILVDSPSGGTEVASKRIIIDSLTFAYERPERATLCFITADSDIVHLLSALDSNHWSTILISNEATLLRMNDAVCNYKLNWESDILHLHHLVTAPFQSSRSTSHISSNGVSRINSSGNKSMASNGNQIVAITMLHPESVSSESGKASKSLSVTDTVFLRTQIADAAIDLGNGQKHSALKSRVGSLMRLADPGRFPTRDDLTTFLSAAVDDHVVIETGYGEYKILTIVGTDGKFPTPPLEITKVTPPLTNKELPRKVIELSRTRPYIIFVPWSECVNRETFPSKAFVHTSKKWAMLMFEALIHAQQAAIEYPWLNSGHLIDWRRVGNDKFPSRQLPLQNRGEGYITKTTYESRSHEPRAHHDSKADVGAVVKVMEMLLESDEVYVAEPVLRYQLAAARDGNTADKLLYFWIEEAVKVGKILLFRRPGVPKGRFYCLPNQLDNSKAACSLMEIDTSEEEDHVINLIKSSHGRFVTRIEIIDSLKSSFPQMESSWKRVKLFQNGARKGIFFVAKDGSMQVVAYTKEDAQKALQHAKSSNGESHSEQKTGGEALGPVSARTEADVPEYDSAENEVNGAL